MLHFVKHILNATRLNRFAGIHDTDPVAGFQDQAKIMGNEEHRRAVFFAQIFHQFHHGGFHSHVQSRGWLIKDQKAWFRHKRHGDHDALLLTAGQLVREGFQDPFGIW